MADSMALDRKPSNPNFTPAVCEMRITRQVRARLMVVSVRIALVVHFITFRRVVSVKTALVVHIIRFRLIGQGICGPEIRVVGKTKDEKETPPHAASTSSGPQGEVSCAER